MSGSVWRDTMELSPLVPLYVLMIGMKNKEEHHALIGGPSIYDPIPKYSHMPGKVKGGAIIGRFLDKLWVTCLCEKYLSCNLRIY